MLRLCPSVRKKTNLRVPVYLLCLTERRWFASFRMRWYTPDIPSSRWESPSDNSCRGIGSPRRYTFPAPRGKQTEDRPNTTRPLILFATRWSVHPIAPATHHTLSAQCSTKKAPMRWTRYPWGWLSPGCPPPYDHLNCGSPEHAGPHEQIPPRLALTVEPLYSQPPLFSNLPGAVSTIVQTATPTQCVPRQAQDSCRAAVTVNVLTPTLNWVLRFKQLHICGFRSPAPALVVSFSPMPLVTSVNQVAAYQVCSHPASVCPVDHVLHGICPIVMALGSQQRATAF